MISKLIAGLRYVSIVAVISSFIGSFLMFFVGAKKIYKAVWGYFVNLEETIPSGFDIKAISHLSAEDIAIGRAIESLDAFLIGLVFLFFAYGVYTLFIIGRDKAVERGAPDWLLPKDLGSLKKTLAQTIIVVLFVLFTRLVWLRLDNLTWELLIMPIAIALLGLTLKFVDFKEK
jgi:uncharacterized membrane protein YqhA